jgi:hypothetical protein
MVSLWRSGERGGRTTDFALLVCRFNNSKTIKKLVRWKPKPGLQAGFVSYMAGFDRTLVRNSTPSHSVACFGSK